ncbi:DUF1015 domain-containing protein [Hespellia stercorisuis]|uniref:Uncharacterized conserved protein, DUF1015 family n=1 Tax=Hespellia stercorisuis DSM 15480 TaxID=1121950 RepID=A0A1M6QGD7_9FIRM|nr:DUF1015 family protein [Hespellia stercorisuis]SHK19107.1 Uncharacterized conserved protein, DUF1015 family [Hespellia stercorisuis DSM 15480]
MTTIKPFAAIRPRADAAARIAALPYDVYNRREAKEIVAGNPLSFLKIDRAETQFPDDTDMYSQQIYDKARDTLHEMMNDGYFVRDKEDCFYIYELTMPLTDTAAITTAASVSTAAITTGTASAAAAAVSGAVPRPDRFPPSVITQTGLVATASIDDYLNGTIKKHENTRAEKELDRIRHVDTCSAQTGPIFLAYRENRQINEIVSCIKSQTPVHDFISEDQIHHRVWLVSSPDSIHDIIDIFAGIPNVYIADGHHRAASAVKVGQMRRQMHPDFNGSEDFNYFLSVLFPAPQLHIFDYNRIVKDLNGHSVSDFMALLARDFEVASMGSSPFAPSEKGQFGMYVQGTWYRLTAGAHILSDDPVDGLDVSILQNALLEPLLGIHDPKTDDRIAFVGGIRGLTELSSTVDAADTGVAFSMYPTSMDELLAVADAGRLMPPKSTWFEPKLRSGLFIHEFDRP